MPHLKFLPRAPKFVEPALVTSSNLPFSFLLGPKFTYKKNTMNASYMALPYS